jgi:hypothetical protein
MTNVSSAATALRIAEALLDRVVRRTVDEEVVVTYIVEHPTCWIVGYDTRFHLQTGSVNHALAGGGPIIVNRRTGLARLGTSALPDDAQLDAS